MGLNVDNKIINYMKVEDKEIINSIISKVNCM